MFRIYSKTLAAVVLLGAMAGCSDLYPTAEASRADLPLVGAADFEFEDGRLALTWLKPLERNTSVTQTIGRWGGLLRMTDPGLNLWVPPGALDGDLDITMAARAGENVVFDLQPHGTQFNRDVWISIDLSKVLNGKELVSELRACLPPSNTPTAGAGDAGPGFSAWLQGSTDKKSKKKDKGKKKSKSDDSDDDDSDDDSSADSDSSGDSDDDSSDTSDSDDATDSATEQDDDATTCKFAWFESLKGLDGVYLDSSVESSLAKSLEDFEVWLWLDGWLTFKTDHFSGYALAM